MLTRQSMHSKTLAPQTQVCSATMGTPICKPRAILRDSLSSLVPKEGIGEHQALYQTLRKQLIIKEPKDLKNNVHKAIRPYHSEDVCSPQEA